MAWTNVGFDGTINEAQWSALAGLLGNGYVAAGNGDCVVTAVAGARSVSVAAGSLYGDGVLSTNSAPETVAMTTPVNGQWYVIALRRTWATNTAALVAIAGATTTTTTPTAPPTSFPTLNTNVGVLTDQPIAWAWCNSANTTVVVYDIRLKAVKSLPPVVATSAERDAKFMTPTQGLQVWRNDLGVVETYYSAYDASTNPGGRGASGGWFTNIKNEGTIVSRPGSVGYTGGSASIDSVGTVSFTATQQIYLGDVFSSKYNAYKIIYDFTNAPSAANQDLLMRLHNTAGAVVSGFYQTGVKQTVTGGITAWSASNGPNWYLSRLNTGSPWNYGEINLVLKQGAYPKVSSMNLGEDSAGQIYTSLTGMNVTSGNYTGFYLLSAGGGTFTGTINVYGYNI